MTHNVASVRSNDSLAAAADRLMQLPIRHLPVVDDGVLVGMLSDRDMRALGAYYLNLDRARQWASIRVADVMTRRLITASPSTSIPELISRMLDAQVGALPVVEGDKLVGIVSYTDLLRAAAPRFS
jgi:acetoin utilization protein AcuB